MRKIIFMLMIIFITQLCCASKSGLKEKFIPDSQFISINKDGSFYVYSECNIYVKPVTPDDWKKLLSFKPFTKEANQFHFRFPSLHFFMVIIENREREPVQIKNVELKFNNGSNSLISANDMKLRYKSINYQKINYNELFAYRKLVQTDEITSFSNIDFNKTVRLDLAFIPSFDKVFMIMAFDWVPVQNRDLTVAFTLKSPKFEKVIDFKLKRIEYRPQKK